MKSLAFTGLLLTAFCFSAVHNVQAQAPMVYGVIFDNSIAKKVSAVLAGSPAETAGIQTGDLVVTVNGASTNGLSNPEIRTAMAKQPEALLVIMRAGQQKTIRMSKAAMDSFGRTCVSGNCETGFGRLRMAGYGNLEYEGQFANATPSGETKIYDEHSNLLYKGYVKDFLANGAGKVYGKDDKGADVIIEEGDYNNGDLFNGIRYNKDGTVLSLGQYEPGAARKLKSVYRTTNYRGKTCNIFVEDIRRGPEGAIYNGKVTIKQLESDNPDARKLLELYYVNGIPNGTAKVWDYDNGVYHFMQYRNGVLRTDGLNAGMIMRIADGVPIASEVRYLADATATANWPNRIEYGMFHFGSRFLGITSPGGGAPLSTFKQLYNGGTGEEFIPGSGMVNKNGSSNSGTSDKQYTDLMTGITPGYTPAQVLEATKQFVRIDEANDVQIGQLMGILNGITRKNYTHMRDRFESLQFRIVSSYTDALEKYKGHIPAKLWNKTESKRNRLASAQVPSYVQY